MTDAELKSGRYQSKDGLLEYDDDGNCVYLSDGKCSIYDNRPYVCREYDCRTFAAFNVADTGLVENGMPRVTQLFKFESEEDSEYLKTVSAIGRQLHEEGALNGASKSEEKAVLIMNRYSERYGGLFSEKTRDTVMKKLNA